MLTNNSNFREHYSSHIVYLLLSCFSLICFEKVAAWSPAALRQQSYALKSSLRSPFSRDNNNLPERDTLSAFVALDSSIAGATIENSLAINDDVVPAFVERQYTRNSYNDVDESETFIQHPDDDPHNNRGDAFLQQVKLEEKGPIVFGDRNRQELIEALKKEEYEIKTGEKLEEKQIAGEMKDRDKETVRIRDYAETIREGGLEGSVGAVTYNTPNKLQDKILQMVDTINNGITNFSPSQGLPDIITQLSSTLPTQGHLLKWESEAPYIRFIRELIRRACPKQEILHAGDSERPDAFPRCMIDYASALPEEIKKDMGLRLRSTVQSTALIDKILNVDNGLCVPIATILNLGPRFCVDVLEIFRSVAAFVKASTIVQEKEKNYYGAEAAMIQIHSGQQDSEMSNDVISSLFQNRDSFDASKKGSLAISFHQLGNDTRNSAEKASPTALSLTARINVLQGRLVFRRTWNVFGLHTMKQEALHLQEVWYNDPVHKWRYSLGLFQWITVMGMWISDESAKLVQKA